MKNLLTLLFPILLSTVAFAQNNVGINTAPDVSAVLDVSSTEKGILVPRMTRDQRNGIGTPATGLMIYQTDNTPGFYVNSGSTSTPNWKAVSGTVLPSQATNSGKVLKTNGTVLSWEADASGTPALYYSGFVTATNTLGNSTLYGTISGWSGAESDGHRLLLSSATTVKLIASLAGSVTSPYTLSLRRGTPSGGNYYYTDMSATTISVSNANLQTINLTGLTLAAGETIAIKIVGTANINAAGQQKTLYYSLQAQ